MQIGFVGLGKMGLSMSERLVRKKHSVVAYDLDTRARRAAKKTGVKTAESLKDLVDQLKTPRIIWVMVPAGKPTDEVIQALSTVLSKGDILVDGGNSYYKDSMKRADRLKEKGVIFLDAGTSGGVWGLKEGYCFMVGGEKKAFEKLEPVFKALAAGDGYAYVGRSGAGHFVKMVHNGIEYGLLQAYAEGFALLNGKKEFNLGLKEISHLWNHGSVIRSWILSLCEDAFGKDKNLRGIKGYVEDSGEGRWAVAEAVSGNIPAPVITLSLLARLRSRQKSSFSDKVIAALRNEFGGHAIKKDKFRK
ncbi:MAG: decarboxylating 6-phosphogluconate dehydrogenase [Candidatus Omnitrophica bacterium]|nr:decarboxylating 6-phosphogluconate dehydrogenase [Candidatus Omnitrophota bacterium]